jgi:hypothetical protein
MQLKETQKIEHNNNQNNEYSRTRYNCSLGKKFSDWVHIALQVLKIMYEITKIAENNKLLCSLE